MATIDYKEKYEQALERARQFSEKPYLEDSAGIVEYIFPELRESKDEKIRKAIIEFFELQDDNTTYSFVPKKDILVWLEKQDDKDKFIEKELGCIKGYRENAIKRLEELEKQGEQNQKHFELKAGHWYICHRAFCCRADHLTVKEGERFMCEKDGIVKGFVIKEPEKYFYEVCAPAPIDDEQKPAWSEEDGAMWKEISDLLWEGYKQSGSKFSWDDIRNWVNPKLKSIRPQNRWKPSNEQMDALKEACDKHWEPDGVDPLYTLYQDLNKLKG